MGLLLELLELDPVPARSIPGAPGQHDQDDEDDSVGDDDSAKEAALAVGDVAGVVREPLCGETEKDDLQTEQSLLDVEEWTYLPSWFVVNDTASEGDDDDGDFQNYRHGI